MKYFHKVICLFLLILQSCQANFLDVRPDKSLVVPNTFSQLEALLDNSAIMNSSPGLSDLCTDDYQVTENAWLTLSQTERNAYTWQADLFASPSSSEWNIPYKQIFYANIILDEIGKENFSSDQARKERLKGSALFYRAMAYYQLLQLFAQHYLPGQNDNELGVPMSLSSRIDKKVSRQSLGECYLQIINDLIHASKMLPNIPEYKSRPSRAACYALLSRISLILGKYQNALSYSDSTLHIYRDLLDYNNRDVNPNVTAFPPALPNGNPEVIFHTFKNSYSYATLANVIIDSTLINSYESHDLRKRLFFLDRGNGNFTFRGSYNGALDQFSGLALDEVYLIRSESLTKLGRINEAITTLNALLVKRYENNKFKLLEENNAEKLLSKIILERRKELLGRGLRWTDLRRLNIDPDYQVTLRRKINGLTYLLSPNDLNYVFPIPENEIQTSGIAQNSRN